MISLKDAVEFTKRRHGNQKRMQGTAYYEHPITVARLLKTKGFPVSYQIAGLFHDLLEDTKTTYDEILHLTDEGVAEAVRKVTKEDGYDMAEYIDRISKDEMARMVKLADRVHNLSDVKHAKKSFQRKYIKETEEWYVKLADGTVFEKDLNKYLSELKNILNRDVER